eukprot:g26908.t1
MSFYDVFAVLVHELTHAFDFARAKVDTGSCVHIACTEIRAWNLSGECDLWRNSFKYFGEEFNFLSHPSYEVYDLFAHLLRQVIVERPENPIKFFQECLKEHSKLCICVMGPPGVNRSKYCQQLAADYKLKHVHQSWEDLARQNFAAKVEGEMDSEKRDVVEMHLQQYKRHVLTISEFFKNSVRRIEVQGGESEQESVYKTICSNLHYRGFSNAPLRMHRICVLGPCASGRTKGCSLLSRRLGVVHVDEKQAGCQFEEVPPDFVGDEEACALIGARLRQTDCVRKGWVLDGFPRTRAQAEFLRQAHLWPSRVIQLQVADAVVETRASSRRVDPVTGIAYYTPPSLHLVYCGA